MTNNDERWCTEPWHQEFTIGVEFFGSTKPIMVPFHTGKWLRRAAVVEHVTEQAKRIDDLESQLNQLKHDRDGWRDLYTVTAEEQAKRIAELEAQLSVSVFVRDLSDEELLTIRADRWRDAHNREEADETEAAAIRACIAAATRLPEGATRATQRINGAGCLGFESSDGSESVALALPDGPAVVHIVVVPDPDADLDWS